MSLGIGHLVLRYTRFGRYIYMTGSNREAARLSGLNTKNIVAACLTICAATAGAAGMLNTGRLGSAQRTLFTSESGKISAQNDAIEQRAKEPLVERDTRARHPRGVVQSTLFR